MIAIVCAMAVLGTLFLVGTRPVAAAPGGAGQVFAGAAQDAGDPRPCQRGQASRTIGACAGVAAFGLDGPAPAALPPPGASEALPVMPLPGLADQCHGLGQFRPPRIDG